MMRRATSFSCARWAALGGAGACRPVHVGGEQHTNANKPNPLRAADLNRLSFVSEVGNAPTHWENPVGHPVWHVKDVEGVKVTRRPTGGLLDSVALFGVKACRYTFDTLSLYRFGKVTERKVINRCLFLETVAGVPGMVGGMVRHMHSLRGMRRDHGWIHSLLEEAENERMHLLTFMEIRRPGLMFRGAILLTQGVMFNLLFVMYLLCPRFVHRFVGYLEEEAVRTYTHIMELIDEGKLPEFESRQVPAIARAYWRLPESATFRDMFNVIRADEAGHRLVNHTFADMHEQHLRDATNPFVNRLHSDPTDTAFPEEGATVAAPQESAPPKPPGTTQ